jgi:hypothetical protein
MPIIKRRPKENLRPISFRLPEPLLERLSAFADFLNVPQSDIVIAALNHVQLSSPRAAAKRAKIPTRLKAKSNTRRSRPACGKIAGSNTNRAESGARPKAVTS